MKRRVLELNASDERGISVVRDKIKHFASLAVGSTTTTSSSNNTTAGGGKGAKKTFFAKKTGNGGGGSTGTGKNENNDHAMDVNGGEEKEHATPSYGQKYYPNPPFKIIILDEADTVTRDAQAALRRVIEAYSKVTRFILICNYVTRIIEPLASRCAKFRFAPLPVSSMKERILYIANEEECYFDEEKEGGSRDEVIDEILNLSQGDMRRAVTTLQSAHSLSGGKDGDAIKKESIAEMAGLPPPALIDGLIDVLYGKNFDNVRIYVQDIVLEGYSAEYVLCALMAKIIALYDISDEAKAIVAVKVAEADRNLIDGSDETLQLLAVCSIALEQFKKKKN